MKTINNNSDIFISFTLKTLNDGKTFENSIVPKLMLIKLLNPNAKLHHGFMSREKLVEKGISTDVIDSLEKIFNNVDNSYYTEAGVSRITMAKKALALNAPVFVIGDVTAGVLEEVEIYLLQGVQIYYLKY